MDSSSKSNQVIAGLTGLLADTYDLYFATQTFHWNVTGIHFPALHQLFEQQYAELASAIDTIAERIRTLGAFTPVNFGALNKYSSLQILSDIPDAQGMLSYLKLSNETVVNTCNELLKIAEEVKDESSMALASERLSVHEKVVWMYSATLEN